MAEDVARLVAVMEANLKGFTKGMEQAQKIADQRFGAIEKRMRQTESAFAGGFKNIGNKILGGAALFGIERFVSSVVDAASKIKDTSEALGVSTDALQEWGIVAGRSGIRQEEFNTALEKFGKSLGEAQIKGGDMAKLFSQLGISTSGDVEESFLKLADVIAATGNAQQRVAITTTLLGKSAAGLVPFLQQGSAAIRAQGEELRRTGAIMTGEAIDKIDTLGDKWGDLKRQLTATGGNVLAGFADEFSTFADELKSPEFQRAMQAFGAALAEIAIVMAKLAQFMPEIVGGLVGLVTAGPVGGLVGVGVGAAAAIATGFNGPKPKTAADLPFAPSWFGKGRGGVDRSGILQQDNSREIAKTVADAAKAAADVVKAISAARVEITRGTLASFQAIREQIDNNAAAELAANDAELKEKTAAFDAQLKDQKLSLQEYNKAVANLNDEAASKDQAIIIAQRNARLQNAREEIEARHQLNKDVEDQRRETIRSEHDVILEQARGTQDYYQVARELSDENAALEEQRIRDELNHFLETQARQKQEIEAAGGTWADYEEERKAATEKAELAIQAVHNGAAAERIRLNEQETRSLEYQIQIMDQVRNGLEDVFAAGIHGFKSMKDAAAQFVQQLAETALRLYVIRPLLEAIFGRAGTTGAFFDSVFGIPGRASGGPVSAGSPYMVGENGRELFVPNTNGTIIPNIPNLNSIGGSGGILVTTNVHLAGANGDQTIMKYARQGALEGAALAVSTIKKQFPSLMVKSQQTHL